MWLFKLPVLGFRHSFNKDKNVMNTKWSTREGKKITTALKIWLSSYSSYTLASYSCTTIKDNNIKKIIVSIMLSPIFYTFIIYRIFRPFAKNCLHLNLIECTTPTWDTWSLWTECNLSCGSSQSTPSSRSRSRVCVPGTDNLGSQDVTCSGPKIETDTTSCAGRSTSTCPGQHCPPGFHLSIG